MSAVNKSNQCPLEVRTITLNPSHFPKTKLVVSNTDNNNCTCSNQCGIDSTFLKTTLVFQNHFIVFPTTTSTTKIQNYFFPFLISFSLSPSYFPFSSYICNWVTAYVFSVNFTFGNKGKKPYH